MMSPADALAYLKVALTPGTAVPENERRPRALFGFWKEGKLEAVEIGAGFAALVLELGQQAYQSPDGEINPKWYGNLAKFCYGKLPIFNRDAFWLELGREEISILFAVKGGNLYIALSPEAEPLEITPSNLEGRVRRAPRKPLDVRAAFAYSDEQRSQASQAMRDFLTEEYNTVLGQVMNPHDGWIRLTRDDEGEVKGGWSVSIKETPHQILEQAEGECLRFRPDLFAVDRGRASVAEKLAAIRFERWEHVVLCSDMPTVAAVARLLGHLRRLSRIMMSTSTLWP